MITTLQLVTQNTTVSSQKRMTLLNSLPSAGHVISIAHQEAIAASGSAAAAEAARDAALLSRGVFSTTAKALSKGVVSTTGLVGGSGGTNGTFALAFSGGAGSGAAGVFTVAGGAVTSITITAAGDSYTSAPTISFAASSGLTGASATAVIADNVSAGEYFSVPVSGTNDALILYENVAGVATEVVRYPSNAITSQTVNKAKAFPLKQMTRGGETSAANTTLNNMLLDVKVIGRAEDITGKYFRIAYFQNNANISGNTDQGINLEEFDASTYTATGTATTIHNHQNDPAAIDRAAGGVQTFIVTPAQRPNLRFVVTLDVSAMPASGTPVNALNSGAAFSWIVDPACYVQVPAIPDMTLVDAIRINAGRAFPLAQKTRDGTTKSEQTTASAAILDIRVIGARQGKYYRLEWYGNGTTAFGAPRYDMLFSEYDKSNYGTSSATGKVDVVVLADLPTNSIESGVITRVFSSPRVAGLSFVVTYDTSKMPAAGTALVLNSSTGNGYSWIIDESRYSPSQAAGSASGVMTWNTDGAGKLTTRWAGAADCYEIVFGPNGANSLPNIISIGRASGTDLSGAAFSTINTATTDWLPPLVIEAVAGGDGGGLNFTGGNHLVGGATTALNKLYKIYSDGKPVGASQSGSADEIAIHLIHEVMAYNTVTLSRYVARQSFIVTFRSGTITVASDVAAIEAIKVKRDYGPQMVTDGFQGTQIVLGGDSARVAFDSTQDSGASSAYPNAWACVLQDGTNGQLVSWIDRAYGKGDRSWVDAAEPLVRGGGAGNTKWYQLAVGNAAGQSLAAGASYKWRGGYAIQSAGVQPAGYDSVFTLYKGGTQAFAYGNTDASFSIIE